MMIPDEIIEHMKAGAFESLCEHLRARSDLVQNMELMTISGFCRNCLAKWIVLAARNLSNQLRSDVQSAVLIIEENSAARQDFLNALNKWGYEDAAKIVYGCSYAEWKKTHQRNATDEQLRLYNESAHLHATHDANLLKCADGEDHNCLNFSKRILTHFQAEAFESLCEHLRHRSDEVSNMELMTISGFCRNCLAKWLVVEARRISDRILSNDVVTSYFSEQQRNVGIALDSFGYDEAAQIVYGCCYSEWKNRHMKTATDEQLERYNASKSLHASHYNYLLATRSKKGIIPQNEVVATKSSEGSRICVAKQKNSLSLDVCCQDVDAIFLAEADQQPLSSHKFPRPPAGRRELTIGILTVSDRAAANAYESGDLSGSMVESTVLGLIDVLNASFKDQSLSVNKLLKEIVPDEKEQIEEMLLCWSGKVTRKEDSRNICNLIFTTGGTGFSPRDVTPEATISILDRECHGLMSWASIELSNQQPLATLSRAAAGVCGRTIIVNLPGNPAGAAQVAELLFPIILHAIEDLSFNRIN